MALDGVKVLITAGPTIEKIDPVRFISNASSGKMGKSLAKEALKRGAKVTLIHGPLSVCLEDMKKDNALQVVSIQSAKEMHAEVQKKLLDHDVLIMAAAVADYRPEKSQSQKIKKTEESLNIKLIKNPDILLEASRLRGNQQKPVLVGFALETQDIEDNAKKKLRVKRVDLIVANPVSDSIGQDTNKVALVSEKKTEWYPVQSKETVAQKILDRVEHLLAVAN